MNRPPQDRDQETTGAFDRRLTSYIRSRFAHTDQCPFLGPRIFFDSASGSLRLRVAADFASAEAALPDQVNRDTPGSHHVMQTVKRGEEDVRTFLGADDSAEVVPALSATAALFRTIGDAAAHYPGSNVVTTTLDHPATHDALLRHCRLAGHQFRAVDPDRRTGTVCADDLLQRVDPDTAVLAFIHGSNVTGAFLDARRVVREARSINPDIAVIIDGVQYAPYAPVDVRDIGADVYVIAPYKTYGKKGIGFAVLSERFARIPHDRVRGKAADEWSLGSADHINYGAWSAVVDYFARLGSQLTESTCRRRRITAAMSAIEQHEKALLQRLVEGPGGRAGLRRLKGVTVYAADGSLDRRTCVVPFNIEGLNPTEAARMYREEGIVVQGRVSVMSTRQFRALGIESEGVVRVSAAHYNTAAEIDRFLAVTEDIAAARCP